jgi:redox-sensing transcriptional repressor
VEPATALAGRVRELGIALGIIAVPADAAQSVADSLVAAGVRGILNFAPAPLNVPKSVSLSSVDLAIQLESLSYQVRSGAE